MVYWTAEMQTDDQQQEDKQSDVDTTPVLSLAQKRFYNSEQCAEARRELEALVSDKQYFTDAGETFSSRGFVDRHLYHLSMHPNTSIKGYLSNLKLMTSRKLSK